MHGLLGKKIGMTQVYDDAGKIVPVTMLEAGPCFVLQVKTKKTDGYDAIQIGFGPKKEKNTNMPDTGRFKKAGVTPQRFVKELRVKDTTPYTVGLKVEADIFAKGDYVDVEGTSIGKGFQGGVRRHNWKGGPGGHGSMFHRQIGSIQSGARLGRVTKGHPMPGHMGDEKVTVQNLEVIKVDKDANLILVKGPVPGHENSYLIIREARKRPKGFVKHKPVVVSTKKKSVKSHTAAAKK